MIDNYLTGSNGFIGSHLKKRLEGQNTVCIPHEFIGDTHISAFKRLFFLSTYGNMAQHNDWRETVEANVSDLISVLDDAEAHIGTLVYVSTSSVNLPVQTPYSRCKRAAEEILMAMPQQRLKVVIARPYTVTGAGEQREHLIPRLIESCFTGLPMPLCAEATHDYVDVSDFVGGLLMVSERSNGGIYEFGKGIAITNSHVKQLVEQITGRPANISAAMPSRSYDTTSWYCEDRAAHKLGWTPKKCLFDSISEMVADYLKKHERA
jgi:nucleoside-diphosphate-sugar epimerase